MGMLISRHRARHDDQPTPKARKPRRRKADKPAPESALVESEVSPYEALTDDELFDAYVTNVGEDGTAESREDMTAELSALDAE